MAHGKGSKQERAAGVPHVVNFIPKYYIMVIISTYLKHFIKPSIHNENFTVYEKNVLYGIFNFKKEYN